MADCSVEKKITRAEARRRRGKNRILKNKDVSELKIGSRRCKINIRIYKISQGMTYIRRKDCECAPPYPQRGIKENVIY